MSRHVAVRAVFLTAAALMLLSACTDASEPPRPAAQTPPALGGATETPAVPPSTPMSRVERAVAERLSSKLRAQHLAVEYLDCPAHGGRTPKELVCRGYVDGVVVDVGVRLSGSARRPSFDAWLGRGMLATQNLVRRLEAEGYAGIDCGERRVYRAVVGRRIVCAVHRDGARAYVVATVTDDNGTVEISDY